MCPSPHHYNSHCGKTRQRTAINSVAFASFSSSLPFSSSPPPVPSKAALNGSPSPKNSPSVLVALEEALLLFVFVVKQLMYKRRRRYVKTTITLINDYQHALLPILTHPASVSVKHLVIADSFSAMPLVVQTIPSTHVPDELILLPNYDNVSASA